MSDASEMNIHGSSNHRVDISLRFNKNNQRVGMSLDSGGREVQTSMRIAGGSRMVTHAEIADKLSRERKFILVGDVTGEGSFDGSSDATIYTIVQAMSNEDIDNIIRFTDNLIESP